METNRYNIPLLTSEDIEVRVKSVSSNNKNEVFAVLLLYKNARVDMKILDKIFGITGWQRSHEVINNNLFCSLDIWDEDKKVWVRKQDVGTENFAEKEKSQASDSFKRACTNVGIGRELYTAPSIFIKLNENECINEGNKFKCKASTKFFVKEIGYNENRNINKLVIVDRKGNKRFEF